MPQTGALRSGADKVAAGVYLLFDAGHRPDRTMLLAALEDMPLAAVSHDPETCATHRGSSAGSASSKGGKWLELMLSGMTFDLLGLSPGPGVEKPEITYRFACEVDRGNVEAVAILPGPHIADGANSVPIVRAMLDLACGLARRLDEVQAVCWSPARSAISMPMFCQSVEGWLSGGPFPALGMTGFSLDEAGTLRSEGLAHFLGQELAIAPDLAVNRIFATGLGARIVHELIATGKVDTRRSFFADGDVEVSLSPSQNGEIIEVTRM